MSKYTTEVRYICESEAGLTVSGGANEVENVIALAIPKVFNFDFPIFDESYRRVLETKILRHYYTREIAHETVGLWKLKLKTKLNEIMPYYNKLYESELLQINPLYTHNLTRTRKTDFDSNRTTGTDSTTSTSDTTNGTDLYSDTPQGSLTGVLNETYLTNARKTSDSSTGQTTFSSDGDDAYNSTEDYIENVSGYEGKDVSDLLLNWRKTFLNIDMMIINELEPLFFQLW